MENSIEQNQEDDKSFQTILKNFFSEFDFRTLLSKKSFKKIEGISCFKVLKTIFLLVFTGKNWYRTFTAKNTIKEFGKDVVYRFLNSFKWKWEELLLSLSTKVIHWLNTFVSADRVRVLIADDTFFDRTRSKVVELLSWVYDHVDGRCKKGFTKLTLGWSDGNTYIPISFRLVSSSKKKNLLKDATYIDKKYPGHERRVNAKRKKTDLLFDMIREVTAKCIYYKHLLFDAWFAYPKIITRFKQMNVNIITRLKKTPKIFYKYREKFCTLSKIYAKAKKRLNKKTNRVSVIAWICNFEDGIKTKAKIVFIRDKKNWIALLSTDIELTEEEIIRIYGMRWNIEIFFKMCKSYLKLAKEFQGRSFDMLVAHSSIVYIRYIMLAVMARKNTDEKTFGDLFFYYCEEIKSITFAEALQLILTMLNDFLMKSFSLSEKKVHELLLNFISSLPPCLGKYFT
jgi:hypothetical protein